MKTAKNEISSIERVSHHEYLVITHRREHITIKIIAPETASMYYEGEVKPLLDFHIHSSKSMYSPSYIDDVLLSVSTILSIVHHS